MRARRIGIAAAVGLALATAGCGSSDSAVRTGDDPATAAPLDAATAAAVVEAGALTAADLGGDWAVSDRDEDGEDVAVCLELVGAEGDPGVVAAGGSEVLQSSDDRGPTLVYVTAQSTTVVHESPEAAAAALDGLDEAALSSCVAESTDVNVVAGEEGDEVSPVSPAGVGVDATDGVDAGDESRSFTVTYDQDFGDGDDNTSAVEVHAVRVGPVVQVVWTTRDGEAQEDGVVEEPTVGIDDAVAATVDRVADAAG